MGIRRALAGFAAVVVTLAPAQVLPATGLAATPTSDEQDSDAEGGASEDQQGAQEPDPVDFPDPAPPLEALPELDSDEPDPVDPEQEAPAPGPAPAEGQAPLPGEPADEKSAAPPAQPAAPDTGSTAPAPAAPDSTAPSRLGERRSAGVAQRRAHARERAQRHHRSHRPRPVAARPPAAAPTKVGRQSSAGLGAADPSHLASRAIGASNRSPAHAHPTAAHGKTAYTVQNGDSLWAIAARRLPARAANADIVAEVHRLWSLNAARVGTGDPNLITPGQHLRLD